jgi:NADH-quinone oxidoreductase subunit J
MIELQQILFWVFSVAMLVCAALVITRDNLVNSAMLLIQVFLCMAGLFLLLQAFFLAIIQVLVYAGAVVVLFLFVIMLLRPEDAKASAFSAKANAGAIVAFLALCGVTLYTASGTPAGGVLPTQGEAAPVQGGLRDIVQPVFSQYLLPFELTALILLAAMIGVVVLSKLDAANKVSAPNRLDALEGTNNPGASKDIAQPPASSNASALAAAELPEVAAKVVES